MQNKHWSRHGLELHTRHQVTTGGMSSLSTYGILSPNKTNWGITLQGCVNQIN